MLYVFPPAIINLGDRHARNDTPPAHRLRPGTSHSSQPSTRQGGRPVCRRPSLTQIAGLRISPIPQQPTEGKTAISGGSRSGFAELHPGNRGLGLAPALVLRAPASSSSRLTAAGGHGVRVSWKLSRLASHRLRIIDGHAPHPRIHLDIQGIADDLEKERRNLLAARRNDDEPARHNNSSATSRS